MWKKTLLSVLLFSGTTTAEVQPNVSPATLEEAKQQGQQAYQQSQRVLAQQRENFLQLETLLKSAERQGRVSETVLALAQHLKSADYPLKSESDWLILNAKLASERLTPEQRENEILQFTAQYPQVAKRHQLSQLPYHDYYLAQKWSDLIAYSEKAAPASMENVCRLFAAKFQMLAEKSEINPEAEQAGGRQNLSPEMAALLMQFDQFWLGQASEWSEISSPYWQKNATLPLECGGIESYWRDQGFKTVDKIQQKTVYLFDLRAKAAITALKENSQDADLNHWLARVEDVLNDVTSLQDFVKNQPLAEFNQHIIEKAFPRYIRTLSEQMENPDFAVYQTWADKWGMSEQTVRSWKIAFISRLFDNPSLSFQQWRDEQLNILKEDTLTERRLRTAILQQTALQPWLDILSAESRAKAEWRYWQAKAHPAQRDTLLAELAKERGFYPMLAAHTLNRAYQLTLPTFAPLTAEQQNQFAPELARIEELRNLKRFGAAKIAWIDLLQAVSFDEKIALTHYAHQQNWFDLAVEGTIQAKAWDYIQLRLPNAYSGWFDLHLTDKKVAKTFAMAIARQESAWNAEARSHANAMGLMQLLASTAKQTAENDQLPFSERDLLDPFKNIMLGTAHLAELNEKYPNNRILIAAAYNAGARRVEQWLKRAGGRLAMDEFIATIPFLETRGYVQNVLAYDYYYQVLQHQPNKRMFTQEEQRRY